MVEKEDLDYLMAFFVSKEEFSRTISGIREDISGYSNRLSVIETKLSLILWLLAAVGSGTIAMLIKVFFGG